MKKIISLFLSVLTIFSLSACGLLPKEEESPPAPLTEVYEAELYQYTSVMRGDIVETTTASATYQPTRTEKLCFGVSDVALSGVYVELGQQVEAGTLLAELDCQSLKEQLSASQHSLNLLQIELNHQYNVYQNQLDRLEEELDSLTDDSAISVKTAEIQKLKSDYDAARKSLNNQTTQLGYDIADLNSAISDRQIYAGINGIVTEIASTELTYMSVEKETFLSLEDQSEQLFVIDTSDAVKFEAGQQVSIQFAGQMYQGEVVDPADYSIEMGDKVRAYVSALEDIPGVETDSFVRIYRTDQEKKNVLYVPSSAVSSSDGQYYVYVLGEDGLKQVREIEVGLIADKKAEIISGLSEGEKVVLN